LDESVSGPLYQQLERKMRQAILQKKLAPGDALPAERELAEQFAVSRITIRKALDALVAEGLLNRRHGTGTFIANARVEKNVAKLASFTEEMQARGRTASSVWIHRARGEVTPEESLILSMGPGTPVYRFHRIRYADGAPMALDYSTIPAFCLPSQDAVESSLYEALDATGHRPTRALQRLRAVLFTDKQAQLLEVAPRDAGLLIERRGFLKDGRMVEVTQSYFRGDAYDFVAELNMLG
jgi:GntR family transcriptional regulator